MSGTSGSAASRDLLEVVVSAVVITAWMGLLEALLVCVFRRVPDGTDFLQGTTLGYGGLGGAVGIVWGALCESASRRRGWCYRRTFYLISLTVLTLLLQVVVHTHVHWPGAELAPGSPGSLAVTALEGLAALAIIGLVWIACTGSDARMRQRSVLSRRSAFAALAPLAIVVALPLWGSRSPQRSDLPNVLMIVLDTTRVDRLSAYGYGRPTTPALGRVAAEGLRFDRAYASAPWTLPSHASMFTGEHPSTHNATEEHRFLGDRLPTLAEHLLERGFATVAFARQPWLSDETGLMRGFERFYDLKLESTTALATVAHRLADALRRRRGVADKGAAAVTRKFIEWVGRDGDRPFFAFINYMEPHAPYAPPSPYRERFLDGEDTPWGRRKHAEVEPFNAGRVDYGRDELAVFGDLYDAAVAYQDSRMGEALEHMRERGLLDDTLLIITSDHGENLGEHDLLGHSWCLYDTLLRVPLVVRMPGVVPAGRVTSLPVENRLLWPMIDMVLSEADDRGPIAVDRFASVLRADDAAGAILSELDRRSPAAEVWSDPARARSIDRRLRSLVLDEMKYIWSSDGRDELYDLGSDPAELSNLASGRAGDLAAMRDLLEAKVAALDRPDSVGEAPELSRELQSQLRSLGYLD